MNVNSNNMPVAILLFVVCLAGCGSYPTIIPGETTIHTAILDDRFSPDEWRVPAGEQITLVITNKGVQAHDWTIMARPSPLPFRNEDRKNIFFSHPMQAGEATSLTFISPSAPGEYQVLSTLPGDVQAGLVGHLVCVDD